MLPRPAAATVVMLMSVCLSSCLNSQQPLSNPEQAQRDDALLGTWVLCDPGAVSYYHIGKANEKKLPPGWYRIINVDLDPNHELNMTDFPGFATTIDGYHYLSLVVGDFDTFDASKIDDAQWLIFQYEIKGDRGTLRFVTTSFVEQQIRAGKINGHIDAKKGETLLTGTTAEVAAWVAAHREQIFSDGCEFRRLSAVP